jgi:hypothetical protein
MLSGFQKKHLQMCINEGIKTTKELVELTRYNGADIKDFLEEKSIIKNDSKKEIRQINS